MQHFAESKEGHIGEIKQMAVVQTRRSIVFVIYMNLVPVISASSQPNGAFFFTL